MKTTYGTSGFRYHHKTIEKIAYKIGIGLVFCSVHTNKKIGVMITASHNKYYDNGVKITDDKGLMISEDLENIMTGIVNSDNLYINKLSTNKSSDIEIVIGQDTRTSGDTIKNLIIKGAKSIYKNIKIIDLGQVTTPQHHYYLYNNNNEKYIEKYVEIYSNLTRKNKIIVDCANGVGYLSLNKILKNNEQIIMVNTNIDNNELLNDGCGSDYVINNNIIPCWLEKGYLGVSFDGDADRIVCYFIREDNKLCLLDGDHISALILYYLVDILKVSNVTVVHTNYSNGGFIDYVESKNIKHICCPTGVKYLDRTAREQDIGLYFECNGHGTCLIKKDCDLKTIFNQTIGDAIGTLAGIIYILNKTGLLAEQWYNLYKKKNSVNKKYIVQDKSIYKTDYLQTVLIEPTDVSIKLKQILAINNVRGFVRPSGTENVIRLYVEGYKSVVDLERIACEVEDILY